MRQKTISLAVIGALGLLAASLAAEAQQAAKVYRIGVLANAFQTAEGPLFEVFLDGLRKLGYVEGKNTVIEWRSSEGNFDRLPALAADLVRAKVDVIVAASPQPARAAAEATKTIPIVSVVVVDPGGLAQSGGNITALSSYVPEHISAQILQLLKEAAPKASRLAVLTNPANPLHRQLMSQGLPSAAQQLRMTLLPLEVGSPNDFESAFDTAVRERADALCVLGDARAFIHRTRVAGLAAKNRLPAIYTFRAGAEAGALMSYGPPLRDLFRRAATSVDRLLKGAKPADLPVEQPAKFELVVNLKTAKALGLTIPQALLQRADEVIQ